MIYIYIYIFGFNFNFNFGFFKKIILTLIIIGFFQNIALADNNNLPKVVVSTTPATVKNMDIVLEATGTVQPVSVVEVKAQMSSVITQVHIKEGQMVRTGQLLFSLDTRADAANTTKLQAQVTKNQALLADAQRQLARSRDLLAKNFIAQGAVDTHQTAVESQQATVAADQANVVAARVTLSYGKVVAATAGRVGLIPVFVGTTVQANTTPLTTITRLDPIDVVFSVPQASLPDLLRLLPSGQTPVKAILPENKNNQNNQNNKNNKNDELSGHLHFVDSVIDAATGTVRVKARFVNTDYHLWPGAFVKVILKTTQLDNAIAIPTTAIIQSARGAVVYVAENGKATLRPIKVLAMQGALSAVSNIKAGEKIIVNGRQNLRPDNPITEKSEKSDASVTATGPAKAAP